KLIQLASLGFLIAAATQAQSTSVRVGTSIEGAKFIVDGVNYDSSQTFLWPIGSKHIVQFPFSISVDDTSMGFQLNDGINRRYFFGGWQTNGQNLVPTGAPVQVITVNAGMTQLIASVTVEYKVL